MTDREFPFEDVEIRSPKNLRRVIEEIHRLMDEGEIEIEHTLAVVDFRRTHQQREDLRKRYSFIDWSETETYRGETLTWR